MNSSTFVCIEADITAVFSGHKFLQEFLAPSPPQFFLWVERKQEGESAFAAYSEQFIFFLLPLGSSIPFAHACYSSSSRFFDRLLQPLRGAHAAGLFNGPRPWEGLFDDSEGEQVRLFAPPLHLLSCNSYKFHLGYWMTLYSSICITFLSFQLSEVRCVYLIVRSFFGGN